jgi:glycosyltransferase involved in cell wall biosynthesis
MTDPAIARPEVTAVMPCLDEARTIATCIRKAQAAFRELGIDGEVVVADNGSCDGSQALARSLGARVVDVKSRGYGAALMGGIEAARGEIVVMGDADDSYDWGTIGLFVDKIRSGFDFVMGNRFQGGIRPGAMSPLHRYFGNPILSLVARIAFHAPIGDFHCGMRAFTPEAFRRMQVRTPGMEFATEMVANAVIEGLKIGEVPVVLYPDGRDRPPHLRTFRDGWRHLLFIATYAPDHVFLGPALATFIVGVLLVCLLAGGPVWIGSIYLGIHFLALGSMLTLCGLSLLVYGTLAKLLIRRTHPAMRSRLANWALRRFRVENGLLVGLALIAAGVAVQVAVLTRFVVAGGGPSESTVHPTIAAATLVVAGVQLCFSSVLVRLMAEEIHRTEAPENPGTPPGGSLD